MTSIKVNVYKVISKEKRYIGIIDSNSEDYNVNFDSIRQNTLKGFSEFIKNKREIVKETYLKIAFQKNCDLTLNERGELSKVKNLNFLERKILEHYLKKA